MRMPESRTGAANRGMLAPRRRGLRTHASRRVARTLRGRAERLLDGSGVTLNGPHPWDVQVHDVRLFARVSANGSRGFGDAYVEGWWDAADLSGCLQRLVVHGVDARVAGLAGRLVAWRHRFSNAQRGSRG